MYKNLIPPVEIGDKVHYMRFHSDHTVTFHPYTVRGVACLHGKWYVVDDDRSLNEVNTRWCVIGYRGAEVT